MQFSDHITHQELNANLLCLFICLLFKDQEFTVPQAEKKSER